MKDDKLHIQITNLESENKALKLIMESLKTLIVQDGKTIEELNKKIENMCNCDSCKK